MRGEKTNLHHRGSSDGTPICEHSYAATAHLDVHGLAQPNQALACWSIQVHFLQLLHGNSFQGIRRPFTKPVTCTAVDQGWIGTQAFPVVAPVAAEAAEFFALRPILCSALHMCILGLYRNHHTFSLHTYICWQSTRQASTGHEYTVASTEVLT